MEELKLERISDQVICDLRLDLNDNAEAEQMATIGVSEDDPRAKYEYNEHFRDACKYLLKRKLVLIQLQADQQVVDKLVAEITRLKEEIQDLRNNLSGKEY